MSQPTAEPARKSLLSILGPGMLVAATGVGAGDLAGGALAGERLGTAIHEIAGQPERVFVRIETNPVEESHEWIVAALEVTYRIGRHDRASVQ